MGEYEVVLQSREWKSQHIGGPRSVRGRVCVTARGTNIVKDLADISDKIYEDLIAFDDDEDATLPSERA